jgi:hypothetical protein
MRDDEICRMKERLGSIECRLDSLERRLLQGLLEMTGFLALLMTIYKFW